MHVISTYLPPTAVTHAITARLKAGSARYLVIAKINRVEVFSLEREGLELLATYELWGRIVALEEVVVDDGPSSLLIITDHPDRSVLVLELDIRTSSLVVTDTHSLRTFFNAPLEESQPCTIDPSRTIVVVTLFQGLAHIFTFARESEKGTGKVHISQQFDCRLRQTYLISLTFLPTEDPTAPEVALLFQDKDGHRQLISYGIDFDKEDFVNTSTMPKFNFMDEEVSTIITIPNTNQAPGGVLVWGGSEIIFEQRGPSSSNGKRPRIVPNRQPDARLPWPGSEITGYGFVDDNRLLLSDNFGKLHLLSLARRGPTQFTYALSIALLGESSPAASIAYLNAGVVYLASVLGDSLLLRIQGDGRLETLDSFKTITPMRDAILADLDESGEPSIVTCSGQGNTGGLRVIRNGVDVKELATIDGVESIRCAFTIRDPNIQYDSYLLLSLFSQSKLINILEDPLFEEVTIQEFPGFSRAAPTLAIQEVKDPEGGPATLVVQVLPNAALLIDMSSRRKVDEWHARISLASCNQTAICLVLSTAEFVDLRVDHRTRKFHVKLRRPLHHSASVLSVRPISPGDKVNQIVTIGFWAEHVVKLYKLEDLKQIGEVTGLSHAPRSVLLWKFGAKNTSRLHALIGTANGNLLIAKLDVKGPNLDVKTRRTLSLGTRPVDVQGFSDTGEHVIACGSRAIVLSWEEDREGIAYHRISTKNVENVTPVNTAAFPNSFLFNLGISLSVCRLGALQKLQIDSIPLGLDNPIQVAYHPELKVFGVCCLREEPPNATSGGSVTSSFKLIDALAYDNVGSYACEPDEQVISVSVVDLTIDGNEVTYFAAGTMSFAGDDMEPSAGRILLFEPGNQRSKLVEARGPMLTLKVAHAINVSASAITCVDGVLVVAMSCSLGVYRLENDENDDSLKLKLVANWPHNFLISSVVVDGHNIAIGDLLQSVTILNWDGKSLRTVAKDWATLQSLGLTVDENYIIQSEMGRNLVSHQLVGDKLDRRGYYHVGETISKLLRGNLRIAEHNEESGVTAPKAKHLLFTSSGRISIISECNYDTGMLLHAIQRNMNEVILGHKANPKLLSWRTPSGKPGRSDSTEMYGFIDGDFVEQYLRYSGNSNEVKRILEGSSESERLPRSEAEIRAFIQDLQRA